MSERLPPLTDRRLQELTQITRNGPDVVSMAQELIARRKAIAELISLAAEVRGAFDTDRPSDSLPSLQS